MVSKPNTRTKKNNNVMMGHVETGEEDDDVSCATEAVSNKAGGFRRAPFGGGYQAKQAQDDDDVSCATEAVSNKTGGFRRAPFGGGYQAKKTQDDDDDNASVFSAMTEVTEVVANKAPVNRKPWRPSGYRGVGGGDGDNASVMSGTSAATEVVSNRNKPTLGGRSSKDSDDCSVNSAASGRSARSGRSAASGRSARSGRSAATEKIGGSFNAPTLSNNNDDESVMSEATEMVSNTRKPRKQGSFRRQGSFSRPGSFHLQGISEGDDDEES